jgi:hypothetical protein
MSIWPDNIGHLNISSWIGVSIGAVHVYGNLHYNWNRTEIKRNLTQEEANKINKKEDMINATYHYKKGDECGRFDTEKEIIDLTIKLLEKEYPQVDLLLSGDGASVSVNKAFWGKDKKLVDKINELYKEADKLDFYSGKDDDRMEVLDDEFEKMVGLELLKN